MPDNLVIWHLTKIPGLGLKRRSKAQQKHQRELTDKARSSPAQWTWKHSGSHFSFQTHVRFNAYDLFLAGGKTVDGLE